MIVINLYGGSGMGKSTLATYLFYKFKMEYYNTELVTEYAKDLTWSGNKEVLADQMLVTKEQYRRQEILRGKVDFCITDSPLLLAMIYGKCPKASEFSLNMYNTFDNIEVMLKREKRFIPIGRNETKEQAIENDGKVLNLLTGDMFGLRTFGLNDRAKLFQALKEELNSRGISPLI